MQQPAGMVCNVAYAAMRDMSCTASFMLETQIDLSHLRLKVAEAALEDVRKLEREPGGIHDQISLTSTQSTFMKMQSSHSTTALKTWVEFTNKLQAAHLRRLMERTRQVQQPGAQTSSSQSSATSPDSLEAFFDSFSLMAPSDSEVRKNRPARHTPVSAEKTA